MIDDDDDDCILLPKKISKKDFSKNQSCGGLEITFNFFHDFFSDPFIV